MVGVATDRETWIGKAVPRLEDEQLLRGEGRFMDDIDPARNAGHAAILRSPFAHARIVGLDATAGYFASRSAALGRVPAETVIACFYNFCPDLVRAAIPAAWDLTTPEALLAARLYAADRALRRGLGESLETSGIAEAAELARRAAESACDPARLAAPNTAIPARSMPLRPRRSESAGMMSVPKVPPKPIAEST